MPRGTTLAQIRYLVRAELGQTLNVSAALDADKEINALVHSRQLLLCADWQWPFLQHRWDVALVAGTRFYALPTVSKVAGTNATISPNFDWPVKAEAYYNGAWHELEYGIGSEQYNYMNSEGALLDGANVDQLDPAQRWQFESNTAEAADADKIEIWPVPASAGTFRLTGQRLPVALYSAFTGGAFTWTDAAKADLDDLLLAYSVAVAVLAKDPKKQAVMQEKQALFQRRLQQVRQHYPAKSETVVLGKNLLGVRKPRTVPIIVRA